MTININGTGGLFPALKKLMDVIEAAQAAQATDVPDAVDDLLTEMAAILADNITNDIPADAVRAANQWSEDTSLAQSLRNLAAALVIKYVGDDLPAAALNLDDALAELVRQLIVEAETVERNVPGVSITRSDANAPLLAASLVGTDGRALEQVIPEVWTGAPQGTSLALTAPAEQVTSLSALWPTGSGFSGSLSPALTGLLTNGSFDLDNVRPNSPNNWLVPVGDIGTTMAITNTEIQTITISGTPTSGTYTLSFTRLDGVIQSTLPLAYNATGSEVEDALADFAGMSGVSVTTTGTSPNFAHTVAFNSVAPAGDQPLISSINDFDTGSIAIAQATAGSANSLRYRALTFLGNASELTTIQQRLRNINGLTALGFAIQLKKSSGATGTLRIALIDGQENVLADEAGTANSLSVDISTMSSSAFTQVPVFFRTPATVPDVMSLRIGLTTAINSTKALYLDDAILTPAVASYDNGPLLALFANVRDLIASDRYTATITNNHAGRIQTWFNRWFGIQLPSAASSSETITD